jgi:hypothetical protein
MPAGTVDRFTFDFTADVGRGTVVLTSWACAMAPNQPVGVFDPAPQSRVMAVSLEREVVIRSPIDGSLERRRGCYSVALVGGFPMTAVGGVYILEAKAGLSDGRVLSLNSTVLCPSSLIVVENDRVTEQRDRRITDDYNIRVVNG